MFGFLKRRAQARAAEKAAALAKVTAAVYETLSRDIANVLAAALAEPGLKQSDTDTLVAKAASVQRGIDMVLLENVDAYGSSMRNADRAIFGGATLAHGALNMTIFTGKLNHPDTWGDIRYLIGLSRQ